MNMSKRCIEVQRMSNYLGFNNTCTKKRLCNIYPNKRVTVKAPASAFEGGFNYFESTDLHTDKSIGKTVSPEQYKKLLKKYPKHDCGVAERIKEERRIRKAQGLDY